MTDSRPLLADCLDPATDLEVLARLSGIAIPDAHRDAVAGHLRTAARMADLVYAVPLTDEEHALAPVFTPGQRGEDPS